VKCCAPFAVLELLTPVIEIVRDCAMSRWTDRNSPN
jgi:hypothetical protein